MHARHCDSDLSDLIRRMTGCPAYLDSTNLLDLRTLFNEGVHKTDVLFILATKGVFTRPWCLMEMWEAAVKRVPIVLFPVVRGGWTLEDTVTLLSDLQGQMQVRNPGCVPEVMEHVHKQGVTSVREVEDLLLAHLGLVPTLKRSGRPASACKLEQELRRHLDGQLCARLQIDMAELDDWLKAQHARVKGQLELLSWQSWGSDNQIIASVQTLVNAGAAVMGREPPKWTENFERGRTAAVPRWNLGRWLSTKMVLTRDQAEASGKEQLLIVCAREESRGHLRLLQQEFGRGLRCEVVIGTEQLDIWRGEVERTTRGVVLLQTKSVLHDSVRLLQLFEATERELPLVCLNIVGGGYDFAAVKPFLESLPAELSQAEMTTLRTELEYSGHYMERLESNLSNWITNSISVFFNPAAGSAMVDATIRDVILKLGRGAELVKSISSANIALNQWHDQPSHRSHWKHAAAGAISLNRFACCGPSITPTMTTEVGTDDKSAALGSSTMPGDALVVQAVLKPRGAAPAACCGTAVVAIGMEAGDGEGAEGEGAMELNHRV